MDDHMIDAIYEKIELCFFCAKMDLDSDNNVDITEGRDYKAAKELIKAHNSLVRLYYLPKYQPDYLLGTVKQEWKKYLENNR